jgi:hypothetical protein
MAVMPEDSASVSDAYLRFAEDEIRDQSPLYRELSHGVGLGAAMAPFRGPGLPRAVQPVTSAEIVDLWQQSRKLGAELDPDLAEKIARQVNSLIGVINVRAVRAAADKRVLEAVRTVRRAVARYIEQHELDRTGVMPRELVGTQATMTTGEINILVETAPALVELEAVFNPAFGRLAPNDAALFVGPDRDTKLARLQRLALRYVHVDDSRAPWEPVGAACWVVAESICQAVGCEIGHTAGASAVQFTARLVRRLGFAVAATTIARRLHGSWSGLVAPEKF